MKKDNIKIYEKAKDIPQEWDIFCRENFYMQIEILKFTEQTSYCNQKYCMVYDSNNNIEACFVMFPFKYEFSKLIRLKVQLIFLPLSVSDAGIIAKPNSKILSRCLKKIKGLKLILSTSEEFELLNGIKYSGLPNCMMEIKWKTVKEYIDSMRTKYRYRTNKMIKNGDILTKRVLEDNKEFSQEMYELYKQVMDNQHYILETLNIDFFRNKFAKTIVLELEGRPKAFIQFIEYGEKIIAEFVGFDYKDRDKYNLYYNIMFSLIEYSIENEFEIIDIGQSAERAKLKFGGYVESKYSWIYFNGNKLLNFILQKILIDNKSNMEEELKFNVFKNENKKGD